jgi:5-methylcytosine-specific restriction endonuclease McrA
VTEDSQLELSGPWHATWAPASIIKWSHRQGFHLHPRPKCRCLSSLAYDGKKRGCFTDYLSIYKYMKKCLQCKNPLRTGTKFCSLKCNGQYTEQKSIELWLDGKLSGHTGVTKKVKPFVRSYMLKKYNNKCCKCGWCIPHPDTDIPPLEVNHIDGNSENTTEPNLNLLCPNCHSLTPNFKNRNKGNGKRMR